MDDIFENEFVTWRHLTPVGVKVDEVFGMDSKSGNVWKELARQIFCELGEPNYRELDHFENGAPFIAGLQARLSITHTDHFFAGAFLPKTPEQALDIFSPRTAMGIDAERKDRKQVLKIREKFLSEEEKSLAGDEDVVANILAWTAKEAIYKASMTPGLDFKNNIILESLPELDVNPSPKSSPRFGKATLILEADTGKERYDMILYSYESYGCVVTIALSPKCAKFGKKA